MSYSKFLISELITIQDKYRDLVNRGYKILDLHYFTLDKCLWFIDEVSSFWLQHREILKYCWDRISDRNDCFVLSAAINLKVKSGNHYPFRAIGDYQLLHDPFLKLENFLRAPYGSVNAEEVELQFRHVMKDTIDILTNYSHDFFFIQLSIIGSVSDDKIDTIHQGYENLLKEIFGKTGIDCLSQEYPTYELIEKRLGPDICQLLLFNDHNDVNMSLGERVEAFMKAQKPLTGNVTSGSECDRFLLALFCMYSQAIDTILSCLSAGVYPYFRSEIPAKYFYLLLRNYSGDEAMTEFIGKGVASYFLANGIEQLDIVNMPFDVYRDYVLREQPYATLINCLVPDGAKDIDCRPSNISKIVTPIIDKLRVDFGACGCY